jgi:glycerol-3-phosphate dehydrogenase
VIGPSTACPRLINVAAIRSTGMSASLGIAEHVVALVERAGIALGPDARLRTGSAPPPARPWWLRAARRRTEVA